MKKILSVLSLVFIFLYFNAIAQKTEELFITKEFRAALEKQSRSMIGEPGANYWQNRVNYKISAVFYPDKRMIDGKENIEYFNNSPDTLKYLSFDLIQNLYKKGVARDRELGTVDLTDGLKIKSFVIDGKDYTAGKYIRNQSTKMFVSLQDVFFPNSRHTIIVKWEVTLPGTRTVRMGTYHKTNFMLAYWFPKVAVYDDVMGHADIPHTGNAEFYSEFGDYEVEIRAPAGYSLWATAPQTNIDEVYRKEYVERIAKAGKTDNTIHIIGKPDRAAKQILIKKDSLVWKFKSVNTPDFAFAASKTHLWDATSVISGERRVLINVVYAPDAPNFDTVADAARKIIAFYTKESPAIPYPYPQLTVFNGRGGMEYPGMVNDGASDSYNSTMYLTAHETGHSYYPFHNGYNEQSYAWMDEGMITYLPRKVVAKYNTDTTFDALAQMVRNYNQRAGSTEEIPLMIPSYNTGYAYRYHAYVRPSVAYYLLNDYLGEDTFNLALQMMNKRWAGKHPHPFDFFNTFNAAAGEDLGWFWKPWFFDLGYADLTINREAAQFLTVENKGGFPVPVNLKLYFDDGTTEELHFPMSVWKEGKHKLSIQLKDREIIKAELDTKHTPDAYPEDNIWEN